MFLHQAIARVLRQHKNAPLSIEQVAADINRQQLYTKKDGTPVTPRQVVLGLAPYTSTSTKPIFEVVIKLMDGAPAEAEPAEQAIAAAPAATQAPAGMLTLVRSLVFISLAIFFAILTRLLIDHLPADITAGWLTLIVICSLALFGLSVAVLRVNWPYLAAGLSRIMQRVKGMRR